MMTMELNHYPGAIAQAAQRVNELDSEMMAVQQLLYRVECHADTRSAFDIDFKNDTQRKAQRFEVLLTDKEYQTATNTLMRLTAEKANALAHLEYLRNQFSVAKLETRRAIAQQLTDFESRQLVGL